MEKANFGFMGLGVMGLMLALNVERNGFRVAGYDLDEEKVAKPLGLTIRTRTLLHAIHWKNSWTLWNARVVS